MERAHKAVKKGKSNPNLHSKDFLNFSLAADIRPVCNNISHTGPTKHFKPFNPLIAPKRKS
jgi:hypothetical protein